MATAMAKELTIRQRVDVETRERWEAAAESQGLSLSAWIRQVCNDATESTLAGRGLVSTGGERAPQAEPIGRGARESEGPGRTEASGAGPRPASVVHAEDVLASVPPPKRKAVASNPCPQAWAHRPGSFCKACGNVG